MNTAEFNAHASDVQSPHAQDLDDVPLVAPRVRGRVRMLDVGRRGAALREVDQASVRMDGLQATEQALGIPAPGLRADAYPGGVAEGEHRVSAWMVHETGR